MKKDRQKLFLILPIMMITMLSTTIIRKIENTPPKISSEKSDQRVPVEVFKVGEKTLIKSLNYTGHVKLDKEVMISPRVGGLINKIYVDEGDRVKKGELLASLDDKDLKIKLNVSQNEKENAKIKVEQAKLNLEDSIKEIRISSLTLDNLTLDKKEIHYKYLEAKSNFETQKSNYLRDKTLYEKEALSRSYFEYSENFYKESKYKLEQIKAQEEGVNIDLKKYKLEMDQIKIQNRMAEKNLDQARADLEIASNKLEDAKNQWEYTRIKAEEDGVVLDLFSETGEMVSSGERLFKFGIDDSVKITFGVGNRDLPLIKEEMETEISIDSIPGEVYRGEISKIMPSVSGNSGLTLVEVELDNREHFFKEDMFARIRLIVDKADNVLTVPKEFINIDNEKKYIYVIKDEKALKTIVTTGVESNAMVEISSGINKGDLVASGNLSHLRDGSKVLIWRNGEGGKENDLN